MDQFPTITTTSVLDALLAAHNEPMWRLFCDRFGPIIRAVAFRIGVRRDDLDDVVQDTLMEFMRDFRSEKYQRGKGRLRQYLRGIARHRATDSLRRSIRDRAAAGDTAISQLPDESAFSAAWDSEDQVALSNMALEELRKTTQASPQNLSAFELMLSRPLSPEQIASECGITVEQVYKIKSRLGSQFRQIYERLRLAMYQD